MRANQLASILMHYLIDEIFCHMSKIKLQNMSWSFQLSNLINSGFKLDRSQSFSILCLNKSQSQTDSATFNLMIWFDILKTVKSEFPVTRVKLSIIWDSIKCCVTANIHFLRTMITDKLLEQRWPGIFYLLMSSNTVWKWMNRESVTNPNNNYWLAPWKRLAGDILNDDMEQSWRFILVLRTSDITL